MAIYSAGRLLSRSDAALASGLTDQELDQVQERLGIEFGPDHRELLALTLPVGAGWPDWRHGTASDLRDRLDWPVTGALFDVRQNGFWPGSWGPRPADPAAAESAARQYLLQAPPLIPVYGHRYLPAAPCEPRAPVFSVYQTDVIYYGHDLEDYLDREFGNRRRPVPPISRHIRFWSDLAEDKTDSEL